jgi:hypothetical protein
MRIGIIGYSLAFVRSLAQESEEDPCSELDQRSECIFGIRSEGICAGLLWVSEEHVEYIFDSIGALDGFYEEITCEVAREILEERFDIPVSAREFNVDTFEEQIHKIHMLLTKLNDEIQRFPYVDAQPNSRLLTLMRSLYDSLYSDMQIEKTAANQRATSSVDFSTFEWVLRGLTLPISLVAVTEANLNIFESFASFVFTALDIEASGFSRNTPRAYFPLCEVVCHFKPQYKLAESGPRNFFTPLFIDDHEVEDTIFTVNRMIDDVLHEARRVHSERLLGHQVTVLDVGTVWLEMAVKIIIQEPSSQPGEVVSVVSALFKESICPELDIIAEYLQSLSMVFTGMLPIFNHIIATSIYICGPELLSLSQRVLISVRFKGPIATPASFHNVQYVLHLPADREESERASRRYLESQSFDFLDLVVVSEGAEQVGYIGQRKQWIGQMVHKYFKARMGDSIWGFTDESRRYVTLSDLVNGNGELEGEVRIAGRVMGLALRYDIPMGVPFAKSFIKGLRLLNSRIETEEELDDLLLEEDPVFLKSFDWLEEIDWANPPSTVKWMDFEGLMIDGENVYLSKDNVAEYRVKSKLRKLFWSKANLLTAFRSGVSDVVGAGIFGFLSENELIERLVPPESGFPPSILISGLGFMNFNLGARMHLFLRQWLIETIVRFSEEEVRAFNRFVTGVGDPPAVTNQPWIKVFFEKSLGRDSLPVAHTCHNELQIPWYGSQASMKAKLITAITETDQINGFPGYQTAHNT